MQVSDPSGIVNIPGYYIYRNDYISDIRKYGVCIYVKNNIVAHVVKEHALPNTIALSMPKLKIFILCVYRPPSYDNVQNLELTNYIYNFSLGKEIIILGDFNLPSIKWNSDPENWSLSANDALFYATFNSLGMTQWVKESTFITSGNILDLVFSSENDRIMNISIDPPFPACGHVLVSFEYLFQSLDNDTGISFKLDWGKGDYQGIRTCLKDIDWDFEFFSLGSNEINELLTSLLLNLIDKFIPKKSFKCGLRPWEKKLPRYFANRCSSLWRKFKLYRRTYGRNSVQALQSFYHFNQSNNLLKSELFNLQVAYEETLSTTRDVKPKLFHSYIRHKKVDRPGVGPLQINGSIVENTDLMCEIFADAFSSVFVNEEPANPMPHQSSSIGIDSIHITAELVYRRLCKLNTDSSTGPDGIHPRLLKECALELSIPLYILFKTSLDSGIVPEKWKITHVSPIFKKGSRCEALNYRPISLSSVLCKTLERIVTRELYSFLEYSNILIKEQFGFRPKRSVVDNLLITYDYITYYYEKGMVIDLILFDFQKAFDRVNHKVLLRKLRCLKIDGNLYRWIESFLTNRTMKVCINGKTGTSRPVHSGVPQGSVLGPLLFLIFINHITANLPCKFTIFADDLKLYIQCPKSYFSPGSPHFIVELQECIDLLYRTATSWGLRFAPDKCVHLRFCRSTIINPYPHVYTINNVPIKQVNKHKDLGVVVDNNLKFHQQITQTCSKAGGVASSLLRSTVCRSVGFMKKILLSDIRPILDFASPIWNLQYTLDLKALEKTQRKWTKLIEGFDSLSYRERLHRLNLYSVKGRLLRYDLIYCYKIFHNLSVIKPTDLFTLAPSVGTRGHRFKIQLQHCSVDARKRFFSNRVIPEWNQLSENVVNASSLNVFKSQLHLAIRDKLFEYCD